MVPLLIANGRKCQFAVWCIPSHCVHGGDIMTFDVMEYAVSPPTKRRKITMMDGEEDIDGAVHWNVYRQSVQRQRMSG